MSHIPVKAAYGRELTSQKEVLKYYEEDKDFEVLSLFHNPGSKVNKTDAEREGVSLEIRYGKDGSKVLVV